MDTSDFWACKPEQGILTFYIDGQRTSFRMTKELLEEIDQRTLDFFKMLISNAEVNHLEIEDLHEAIDQLEKVKEWF